MSRRGLAVWAATILALSACGEGSPGAGNASPGGADAGTPVELAHFPLSGAGVPPSADAVFDPGVSQDGNGSLRVETAEGGRLRLYELDDVGPVEGRLVYTGFLRSRDLQGMAFLEMWCHPAEGNPAFVRGMSQRVEKTSDWKPTELGFSKPETCSDPSFVELNVVIQGAGTVWIDDLRLWSVPVE